MYSGFICLSGYAKKFAKDWAINSSFRYASQTNKTTLQTVQLWIPG
jgi:hypothetical protein